MMTILYVYNPASGGFAEYRLSREEPLPHLVHREFTVGQFLAGSHTDIAWTDLRLLQAYDRLCGAFGCGVRVGSAFRRLHDGGFRGQSPHYAGLALDMAYRAKPERLETLRKTALNLGCFEKVEPPYLAPAWLHVQVRIAPPAPPGLGYPILYPDLCGVYVFLLQDALILTGDHRGALTGKMDPATMEAIARFQRKEDLPALPFVGREFWKRLLAEAIVSPRK